LVNGLVSGNETSEIKGAVVELNYQLWRKLIIRYGSITLLGEQQLRSNENPEVEKIPEKMNA